MKRPTLGLALICKNEIHNFPRLLASISDCFDEAYITDTGSTDGTVEYLKDLIDSGQGLSKYGLKMSLYHMEWPNDFGAARNKSFEPVKTDFVMWMDLDDSLLNKENFINWRNDAMKHADYWVANYNYALYEDKTPAITFSRERVFKMSKNPKWNYFVHEGIVPSPGSRAQFIGTWFIDHHRTTDDIACDKGRNLKLFEMHSSDPSKMDVRMRYYWGKELFEADRPMDAFPKLVEAISDPKLEAHDRLLGVQYAALAAMKCNQFERAIQLAHQGLQLDPTRAEYYVIIADSYVKLNRLLESIPFYEAARTASTKVGQPGPTAIFSHSEAYGVYPTNQLARVRYHAGDFERAKLEAQRAVDTWGHEESKSILREICTALDSTVITGEATQTQDIVITTPPTGAYEWDEVKYHERAMGGSETAAIEMADWIHQLTGRPVKVFNMREKALVAPSGVEYLPIKDLNAYFSKYKPHTHIAWRHNIHLTKAPTYLWCHDLTTQGAEVHSNYEKILCLTPYHARYVQAMQGIPKEKIHITRNGLRPERFVSDCVAKNPQKIVFPSSPDRGLAEAMLVCDEVIKTHPIELHVFYGIEHLHKYGLKAMADTLKEMMDARPYVKYHGATQQDVLIKHFKEAAIWLHPCDFIETSCITAMEMLACGTYPVTRKLGGLADTLALAESQGMATVLDADPAEGLQPYIDATIKALDEKSWEKVHIDVESLSWENVAREWVKDFRLKTEKVASPMLDRQREAEL